jgi:hypothetical protein
VSDAPAAARVGGQRRICAVPTVFAQAWWARCCFAHPTALIWSREKENGLAACAQQLLHAICPSGNQWSCGAGDLVWTNAILSGLRLCVSTR